MPKTRNILTQSRKWAKAQREIGGIWNANPKGIPASSPGFRGTSYPWGQSEKITNLNDVAARFRRLKRSGIRHNLFRDLNVFCELSQGSRATATLGWRLDSPCDA